MNLATFMGFGAIAPQGGHTMNKGTSITFLVVGIVMILWGITASESFVSDLSRFFTGSPTDKTIWLLMAGIIVFIVGLGGVLKKMIKVTRITLI